VYGHHESPGIPSAVQDKEKTGKTEKKSFIQSRLE